jgi:hypothetical protein
MTVALKGIFTPPAPETRDIAHIEVVHNGNIYNWNEVNQAWEVVSGT